MNYTLTYRPGVPRDLARLDRTLRRRIDSAMMKLIDNPRRSGSRQLAGRSNLWRIRVGDWRVVYEIDDAGQIVDIHIVAHRREVYRRL